MRDNLETVILIQIAFADVTNLRDMHCATSLAACRLTCLDSLVVLWRMVNTPPIYEIAQIIARTMAGGRYENRTPNDASAFA